MTHKDHGYLPQPEDDHESKSQNSLPTDESYVDVRETLGGTEMDVELSQADVLFDPSNIIFVCLPRVYYAGDFERGPSVNDSIQKLIDSRTPFIPGIKPYSAWFHIFNPVSLTQESCILTYDTLTGKWIDTLHNKIELKRPGQHIIDLLQELGVINEEPTEEQMEAEMNQLTSEELENRIYELVLACLPPIIKSEILKFSQEIKNQIIDIILSLSVIAESPDENANSESLRLYEELKEIFSQTIKTSNVYRYGRPLIVSQVKPSENPQAATFVLI